MQPASSVLRSTTHLVSAFVVIAALSASAPAFAKTINFDSYALDGGGTYNGSDLAGGYTISGATFNNNFTDFGGGCCWEGWSVSNHTDVTTPGFGNQYSAYTGSGFGGSSQYGVLYQDVGDITFASASEVAGTYLTTTTYSALSMLNGDGFAKKFGGVSGLDEDWFNVTIEGFLAGGSTGSVVVYLADYRAAGTSQDYIIDHWTWVDLTGLGLVDELTFTFGSSDVGGFGINTPTYLAVDSFATAVPEPSTAVLLCIGGLILGQSQRSKRR